MLRKNGTWHKWRQPRKRPTHSNAQNASTEAVYRPGPNSPRSSCNWLKRSQKNPTRSSFRTSWFAITRKSSSIRKDKTKRRKTALESAWRSKRFQELDWFRWRTWGSITSPSKPSWRRASGTRQPMKNCAIGCLCISACKTMKRGLLSLEKTPLAWLWLIAQEGSRKALF